MIDPARWLELNPYLDQVLELNAEQRAAWLATLRTENPSLAADLESLLAAQPSLDRLQFLEGNSLDMLGQASLAGQILGAYTLESNIGQGGMGTVWLAHRSDGRFEGKVAIKLLNLALVGRNGEDRFRREGRVLARLTHPHIARILDAGVTGAAQPYLVLEYVEGSSIDSYCDKRRLDTKARLELFLDVLAAVGHAHANLIVHRDIKPSNIHVTAAGYVKLLDFGIAKLLQDDEQTDPPTQLTREGGRALTPQYAAPEQLLGERITVATDVYALGVLLHVLLCGALPSGDGSAPLRGDLQNIVAKALKKDSAERYPTVGAFADDVRRYLANEPVQARADSAWYRLRKFVSRHRVGVTVTLLVVAAVLGSLAFAVQQMFLARVQRDQAVYQTRRADAQRDFTSLMLAEVGPGGQPLPIGTLLDKGVEMLEKQYREEPGFIIEMLIQLSGRYLDLGDSAKELETLSRAERIARRLGDPMLIASVQCNTVETELSLDHVDRARARMADADQWIARMTQPMPTGMRLSCMRERIQLARLDGELAKAISLQRQAIGIMERTGGTKGLDYTGALNFLSVLYGDVGNPKESLAWNLRTEQTFVDNGRGGTIGRYIVVENRAKAFLRAGEVRRAGDLFAGIINKLPAENGKSGPPPQSSIAYGRILARLDRTDEAISMLTQGAEGAAKGQLQSWEAIARLVLASMYSGLGRLDDAGRQLDLSAAFWRANETGNERWLSLLTQEQARLAAASGHLTEGRRMLSDLLRRLGYPQTDSSQQLAPALLTSATLELEGGNAVQAELFAHDAVRLAERDALEPDQSADVGEALFVLARARLARGDAKSARAPLERAVRCLSNGLGAAHPLARQAAGQLASLAQR
ncbi:MAG: serine/threonine-protein kinase [Gammaproteobacteria bacterium]